MAMSTGAKIAVGCVVAGVLAVGAVAVALFGAAWWARGKLQEATAGLEQTAEAQKKIDALQAQANRNGFTAPADRSISEDRLLRFLAVRKQVFGVYERHKAEFEALSKSEKPPEGMEALRALGQGLAIVNEARLIQAQALVDQQMSVDEYRYYVAQVYTTLWAAEISKHTGARNFEQATGVVMDSAVETAEQAVRDARASGQPASVVQALEENARKLREQARGTRDEVRKIDVPPQNIEIFRKHEQEIKKYALAGLEWLGL